MITHLLDTSVYSQPLRKRPLVSVMDRWVALGDVSVCISTICEAEVLFGLHKLKSERAWTDYHTLLEHRLIVLPVDKSVADVYGRIRNQLESVGRPHTDFDLLIAATAIVHDLTLVTCNVRHFQDIPGLRVEDWGSAEASSS